MGGYVPLGYDADGRTLTVNESEAETVRTIYNLYLELGSVDAVKQELDRRGIRTKVRQDYRGAMAGGNLFSRGHLYRVLQSPLYIGQIRHRADRYEGQHPSIVDKETWTRVQEGLKERGACARCGGRPASRACSQVSSTTKRACSSRAPMP